MKMTSYEPTDIAYQKQLRQIAREVDYYLVNNTGELENFRDRIKPLAQRWNNYQKAIQEKEKAVLEHWELVKKNPKLQDKNAKSFKQRGWEWDFFYLWNVPHWPDEKVKPPICYMPAELAQIYLKNLKGYIDRNKEKLKTLDEKCSDYQRLQNTITEQQQKYEHVKSKYEKIASKKLKKERFHVEGMWFRYVYSLEEENEKVFGCWRPKLEPVPENPLERLKPTEEDYRSKPKELLTLPRPTDQNEEYERYYIFLSSVHDNCLPEVQQITKDIWPDDLVKAVGCCNNEWFGDKTAFLNSALERVKQLKQPALSGKAGDITQTAPEKEQNATPAKWWRRIVTGLGKLLEKGWYIFTKSFWETFWEKFGPKS